MMGKSPGLEHELAAPLWVSSSSMKEPAWKVSCEEQVRSFLRSTQHSAWCTGNAPDQKERQRLSLQCRRQGPRDSTAWPGSSGSY